MSARPKIAPDDTVLVNNARAGAEHCFIAWIGKRSVGLLHIDGTEGRYSIYSGKPTQRGKGSSYSARWIHHGELERLQALAAEQHRGLPSRTGVTADIVNALLAQCPVSGNWHAYSEVSIAAVLENPLTTRQRLDVAYLEAQPKRDARQGRTFGVEVKSDRADFLADDKWTDYLGRVHGLAFACPVGAISIDELPSPLGLYYWTGRGLECVRPPVFRETIGLLALCDTHRGMAIANARSIGE